MIDCPALHHLAGSYPERFHRQVPRTIRMLVTVAPDWPFTAEFSGAVALRGEVYPAWTNSYGAVAAVLHNGRKLGVKPGEFEVVDFHEPDYQI